MYRLISFLTCPYVQRVQLMLHEKGVEVETTYIDLQNKPDWFLETSPRGKVPVLVVNQHNALFESQAICEYLEEVHPEPPMLPSDPCQRARCRAWSSFISEELFPFGYRLYTCDTLTDAKAMLAALREKLTILEMHLTHESYVSGTQFGFADIMAAPFVIRLKIVKEVAGLNICSGFDQVETWMSKVLNRASVQTIMTPELLQKMQARTQETYFSQLAAQ